MIIYAPLRAFGPKTKKRNFLSEREKVGGVEIEYNRFFFIFHRHILVVVYGMSIL